MLVQSLPFPKASASPPFHSIDYGVLTSIGDDNGTSQTQNIQTAISYPFVAYDDLGWKTLGDDQTLTVPDNANLELIRLLGMVSCTQPTRTYDFRKWDGAAFSQLAQGNSRARPNRQTQATNTEGAFSAIFPAVAGDQYQLWKEDNQTNQAGNGGTRNWFSVEVLKPGTRYTFLARSSAQAVPVNTQTEIQFTDADIVDTLSAHDPLNGNQIIMPSDIKGLIRVTAFAFASVANTGTLTLRVKLNGATVGVASGNMGTGTPHAHVASRILTVAPNDIISLSAQLSGGVSIGAGVWICVEELPSNHRYCTVQKTATQAISISDITWNVALHDPESLFIPGSDVINFPANATEYRCTFGLTTTNPGLLYNSKSPSSYMSGYAANGNGQTIHNSIGPWHPIGTQTQQGLQGAGIVNAIGGVSTSFFQLEFR